MNNAYQGHAYPPVTDTGYHTDSGSLAIPTSPPALGPTQPGSGHPIQGAPTPNQPAPNGRSSSRLVAVLALSTVISTLGFVGMVGYVLVSRDGTGVDQAAVVTSDAAEGAGSANLTDVQREAAEFAQGQIDFRARSRRETISLLMANPDKHYSEEDATIAVDSLGVDWVAQAKLAGESFIEGDGYSERGLINLLVGVQFTLDEATEAVGSMDVDWTLQAERYATTYATNTAISRQVLFNLMTDVAYGAFEEAEANKGIDDANIDFNAEAAQAAQEALDFDSTLTCEELVTRLSNELGARFTVAEATHGAESTGAC